METQIWKQPQQFEGDVTFVGAVTISGTSVEIDDDELFTLGTNNDIAMVLRTSILGANGTLTGVILGASAVTPAIAADSLILSNVTASGDILIATNLGGHSKAWLWIDTSASFAQLLGVGVPVLEWTATTLEVPDSILFTLGSDNDIAFVNRATLLGANTGLTGVLDGTPVTPAIAANSLIISNTTASGSILIAADTGGTSKAYLFVDAAAATMDLMTAGISRVLLAGTGQINLTPGTDTTFANATGVIIGHTAQVLAGAVTSELQIHGTAPADSTALIAAWSADTVPPRLYFAKSRSATIGTFGIITSGDNLGEILAFGDDGVDFNSNSNASAAIIFDSEGTIAADRIPGSLTLQTATDAAPSVLTNALKLTSAQNAVLGGGAASQTLTFDTTGTDVVLTASNLALAVGAITLNVTGTRMLQSYHTNITSTNALTVDSSLRSKVPASIHDYAADATAILNRVRVVDYQHLVVLDPSGRQKLGIVAESLDEPLALVDILDPLHDGETYPGVNLMGLMALLVKQGQEQNARMAILEARH
jgi:hypothetical protein